MRKKDIPLHASCELCKWFTVQPIILGYNNEDISYCGCDKPCDGWNAANSQFERKEEKDTATYVYIKKENLNMTYTVIEVTDSYIVCHGSGLTREEAIVRMMEEISDDCEGVSDDKGLNELKTFPLECNETGLGITYTCNGYKTTLYMLEEPSSR